MSARHGMANLPWVPPPDPDMDELEHNCRLAWMRDKPRMVAFDTETSGFNFHDPPFCITVAWERQPTVDQPSAVEGHYLELDTPVRRHLARAIMIGSDTWIAHNLKFDVQKLLYSNLITKEEFGERNLHDTECLAHLDDEHREKGLKKLAITVLGIEDFIEVEVKSGKNKGTVRRVPREKYELEKAKLWAKKQLKLSSVTEVGYHQLVRGVVVPYAIKDAVFTWDLFKILHPLVTRFPDLTGLYGQEMRLSRVFLDMEEQGLGVDLRYVRTKVREYHGRILRTEMGISQIVGLPIGKTKGHFNPNSNPQIEEYFYAHGFPRDDYQAETLKGINHPMAEALVALRKDQKILGTYLMALLEGAKKGENDKVPVFHPSIRQHGTVTGRTSSGASKGDS